MINKEISLLEKILNINVKSISWHIPREDLLGVAIESINNIGIRNAYDPYFYNGYKYVSDSMMRWREPIEEYIEKKAYNKIQILTHPIWYKDIQDLSDFEILNQNLEKKICIANKYLNDIRPGYYFQNQNKIENCQGVSESAN